jgi:hypothetical protein
MNAQPKVLHAEGRMVLADSDGHSVGGKVLTTQDATAHKVLKITTTLPLAAPAGKWLHLYIDAETGALLVSTTGALDRDASKRAVDELARRGISL